MKLRNAVFHTINDSLIDVSSLVTALNSKLNENANGYSSAMVYFHDKI